MMAPTPTGINDPAAMALGIMLFAVGYTIVTSTDRFDVFQRQPGVRRTLEIGYFTRLGLSALFPLAMAADFVPGLLSMRMARNTFETVGISSAGSPSAIFFCTLLTTCIQGAILNFLISIYMLVVYGLVRPSGAGRKQQERGFEVIMPEALPVAEQRSAAADDEEKSGR